MPDLAIKDVPDSIYMRLQEQAQRHGWSVDREALNCLNSFFSPNGKSPEEMLTAIREIRSTLTKLHLTDAALDEAINEGRT